MAENNDEALLTPDGSESPEPTPPAPEPVVDTSGAKTAAEALEAGLAAVPVRTKTEKPAGETPAKVDGKEGEVDGDGETKPDADETPEAKAAREKAEAEAGKKEADHINDPIDARLSERTQERIKSLSAPFRKPARQPSNSRRPSASCVVRTRINPRISSRHTRC
jgi:hypothetical protein